MMNIIKSDIENILGEGGEFARRINDFSFRPAQLDMAKQVADAIDYKGCLIAESGTGTGKTFAYLVPAVLSGETTIISTATKHLQDQIFFKDIPLLSHALGKDINASLLKGRGNYLCLHRYKQHTAQKQIPVVEKGLHKMRQWTLSTKSGDLADYGEMDDNSPLLKLITSTVDNCLGSKCPDYDKCFVNKARQRAMKSQIVVVNHHLFFSDLTLKVDGFGELLPQSESVIFDEAHKVPEIATRFFGKNLSSYQLYEVLNDISRFARSEKDIGDLTRICAQVQHVIHDFNNLLKNAKTNVLDTKTIAHLSPQIKVHELSGLLRRLCAAVEGFDNEDLQQCLSRITHQYQLLENWLESTDREMVQWAECGDDFFRLHLTPVSIRKQAAEMMNLRKQAWVFTSATLAVGEDFSSFKDELGIDEVETRRYESPYDFANRTLLYLPQNMCDPRDSLYSSKLLEVIMQVTSLSKGRAFCLFTSYATMNKVYAQLKHLSRYPLLLQGSRPKSLLLEQFKNTDNAILLGTASFWEGVDVKGDALSCVIVDKIPFSSPSDPVYKRKLEADEQNGKNPFMQRQVPDAVITLKQGVGRLMRSEKDSGVLVLCDPRITSSRYGRIFLQSLPAMPVTHNLDDIQRFFS